MNAELAEILAGLPEPGYYDEVVYRGDPATLEFIAFWLSGGAVVAGMNVNVWDVTDDIQALVRAGYAGTLADVARVEMGSDSYDTLARLNGHPSAGVAVQLAPGPFAFELVAVRGGEHSFAVE